MTQAIACTAPKRGAPQDNRNSLRHGLRAGKLPKGCGYIARVTQEFRVAIENAVIVSKGEITMTDAATVHTAIRWERHAQLCQRWLRKAEDKLSWDQRQSFSRDIARASASRDKCIRELGLDHDRDAGTDYSAMFLDPASPETDADVSATTEPSTEPDACVADAQDASGDHSPERTEP